MGTISHHQAKATEFLQRADRAIATHDPPEAAAALRRAASHAVTALAVNAGWKHKSRPQLETVLHAAISGDTLSRSHLKTFRQAHDMTANPPAHPEPVEGRAGKPNHPVHPVYPCKIALRRMRRRAAALIKAAAAIIAGRPKPVHHHKRWQRDLNLPVAPSFTTVRDIIRLPNFLDIRQRFRLHNVAMETDPDPHGFYQRGDVPRRCPCHADLWNRPRDDHRITLSPPWRHALEKTFRLKLPNPLVLTC